MESINVIIDDFKYEVVSQEEEEFIVLEQLVTWDVLDKGTNITLSTEDEISNVEENTTPVNKGPSKEFIRDVLLKT